MTGHSLPDIGPTLPHSREAETAFLGAVLLGSPSTFEEMQGLECNDFFLPFNRLIYRHIKRLKNQGMPTNDIVLLVDSLNATNELEAAGGAGYIAQLSDGVPKLSNLRHYVDIIKTKAIIRERLRLAEARSGSLFPQRN